MPGGEPIGTPSPGSDETIREVPGGMPTAEDSFFRLAGEGTDVTPDDYDGISAELPDGQGRLGIRPESGSGDPAVDVNIPSIWAPLRTELARDYVGLWEIVRRARTLAPELDDEGVRDVILEVVERALRTAEADAGGFEGGIDKTFVAWSGPPEAIIDRISREWAALGTDPNIGEIVWLSPLGGEAR